MTDALLPSAPHLRLVFSQAMEPDPEVSEDKALLALMNRLPPTQRRILAMVMSRLDQLEDDEAAAVALIDRVMHSLKRG